MHLKLITALCFSALLSSALAAPFKVELKAYPKSGMYRQWTLERTAEQFLLNGQILPSANIYRQRGALAAILHTQKATQISCPAGTYEFVVTKGKAQSEKGCMGDERFGQLAMAFEGLLYQ